MSDAAAPACREGRVGFDPAQPPTCPGRPQPAAAPECHCGPALALLWGVVPALLTLALAAVRSGVASPEDDPIDLFKVRVEAGAALPDGIALGLSVAPLPHLRVGVDGLTNLAGFGLRGSLHVVPFASWTLHPIAGISAGRYFNGDARWLSASAPSTITYDFLDVKAGLELQVRAFSLFVAAGGARVWARGDLSVGRVTFDGVIPSLELGLAVRVN